MNPLRPINMNLINHSPSVSKFKPNSYKERKENWNRIERILVNDYGLEPAGLSREEKHQVKDTEDEYARMVNMKNLMPAQYKRYKHMFDHHQNVNDLLSKKFNRGSK